MASLMTFTVDPIALEEEIKRRDDLAESTRHLYFVAARRIQAWIRGILTRNHFRLLHESAVTIQRYWRGYHTRITVDQYLIYTVHQMWQDYYDAMATKIQAFWRGYWIRKTVRDIQKIKRWLKKVYEKNEEAVEKMNKFKQAEIDHMHAVMERESMHWILFILFKLHHLLRTAQRPGVITRIDGTQFTLIEEMLKCLEYKRYVRWNRKKPMKKCKDCQIDKKPSLVLQGTHYERCERAIREAERTRRTGLVPINRSEPYEKQEEIIRKWNRIYMDIALSEAYEPPSPSTSRTKRERDLICGLRREFEQGGHCTKGNELCEKIEKMDCHLDKFHLKCPIHGHPCLPQQPKNCHCTDSQASSRNRTMR